MSSKKLKRRKTPKVNLEIRKVRYFSESFKREKVDQLVGKQISIQELSKLYGVSRTSIYKWLYKYSLHHKKGLKQVVEMESEGLKTKKLLTKISELEGILGRKQIELDFNAKVLDLLSEELGYDVKKKYEQTLSNGFANIQKNTRIE